MTKSYKGLIIHTQQEPYESGEHWQYGYIENGYKVIDPQLHYSCFVLGYNNNIFLSNVVNRIKNITPETANADSDILKARPRVDNLSWQLAEKLYQITGGYRSIFALSGSDANEGAIKLASAYHARLGNTKRKKIVSFTPSYHGSTFLTSSAGFENAMRDRPFYTMDPCQDVIRLHRDFSLDSVDWDTVFCIIVETCSYGDGMIPFDDGFWNKLTYLQNNHNVVLIVDDIFMGGGKTGNFVGWKHLPVTPDIFTMGKAITGGYFPLSVTLYNNKIKEAIGTKFCWNHGYTHSFTLPGAASALEYIQVLEQESLLDNHQYLVKKAQDIFSKYNVTIINQFGLFFMLEWPNNFGGILYLIPINATEEYFNVLADNLKYIQSLTKEQYEQTK